MSMNPEEGGMRMFAGMRECVARSIPEISVAWSTKRRVISVRVRNAGVRSALDIKTTKEIP